MTAIILAGGKSSRFGSDKAFIKLKGIPLIKIQLKLLKNIFKKVIISANSPDKYKFKEVKVVKDVICGRGPLSGIHSGLIASDSFYNFVVACDMPFLNGALIKYIIDTKDNYDIIVSFVYGKFHPLFGIYTKNCIPVIEEMIARNNLNVSGIFPKVKSSFISRREIKKFDRNLLSLVNINTRNDLLRIKQIKGA